MDAHKVVIHHVERNGDLAICVTPILESLCIQPSGGFIGFASAGIQLHAPVLSIPESDDCKASIGIGHASVGVSLHSAYMPRY